MTGDITDSIFKTTFFSLPLVIWQIPVQWDITEVYCDFWKSPLRISSSCWCDVGNHMLRILKRQSRSFGFWNHSTRSELLPRVIIYMRKMFCVYYYLLLKLILANLSNGKTFFSFWWEMKLMSYIHWQCITT